jgi:hypothetical protein
LGRRKEEQPRQLGETALERRSVLKPQASIYHFKGFLHDSNILQTWSRRRTEHSRVQLPSKLRIGVKKGDSLSSII